MSARTPTAAQGPITRSETGARVNAVAEWRSKLTAITGALLLFVSVSGLLIYLLPFSVFSQLSVLLHTVVGLVMVLPVGWYIVRHWKVRRKGNLSHYQLLGYISLALACLCVASGLVVLWQGIVGPRISASWDTIHLVTGIAMILFVIVHLATVIVRKVNNPEAASALRGARRSFYVRTSVGCAFMIALCAIWAGVYGPPPLDQSFADDYNWRFGEDRPFAPSLARVDQSEWAQGVQDRVLAAIGDDARSVYLASFNAGVDESKGFVSRVKQCVAGLDLDRRTREQIEGLLAEATLDIKREGAIDARTLAGSAGCGTSGCHKEIYEEWLPSAHRYSALDEMFQKVQTLMARETSPEHTRYCAGCHDPISLFSGAKNSGNITLSTEGANEGSSCLVCHSIVQTDVQGNGDYTLRPPERYVYEMNEGRVAKLVSDFLIRTYPTHHINEYARPLYKTAEFCGACHKQYLDKDVNTDIGKVQGQNQYDSWKNSRWYHEGNPEQTINCRECHMPLIASDDPARGDATDYNRSPNDERHRSHRTLASNQYIPVLQDLPGGRKHVELTERWLRGEVEIPEIADKWTDGAVVRMEIVAPEEVSPGENVAITVLLTNNKTGHDFPTGPLDMIESWVELKVIDAAGAVLYHTGALDDTGRVADTTVSFRADGFDRKGELIDRHNLWDLVGASYKRTIYPGVTDAVEIEFQCPSMARGRVRDGDSKTPPGRRTESFSFPTSPEHSGQITVTAVLWYRKANPEFLDRVYGHEANVRSPITDISRAETTIKILDDG